MLLRITPVRWFCEVPPMFCAPAPTKKRRKKQDKNLNFMTENSKLAVLQSQHGINCMNRACLPNVCLIFASSNFFFRCTMCQNFLPGTYMCNCSILEDAAVFHCFPRFFNMDAKLNVCLLITFSDSLNQDQDRPKIGGLGTHCLKV